MTSMTVSRTNEWDAPVRETAGMANAIIATVGTYDEGELRVTKLGGNSVRHNLRRSMMMIDLQHPMVLRATKHCHERWTIMVYKDKHYDKVTPDEARSLHHMGFQWTN